MVKLQPKKARIIVRLGGRRVNNGYFVLSLDFELYWGLQDTQPPAQSRESVLNVSRVVPGLLALFEKYGIHATWATVGGIMADGKSDWLRYNPDITPGYADPVLSTYRLKDAIGTEEYPSEMFFAPSLVEMIKNAPNQEIGSHTFSHYYVSEAGTTPEAFLADLDAARKIAEEKGCPRPRSIVFPKNQINNRCLALLSQAGYTAYRGEEGNWIHQKVKNVQFQRALRLLNNYLPITGSDSFTLEAPSIPGVCIYVKALAVFPAVRKAAGISGAAEAPPDQGADAARGEKGGNLSPLVASSQFREKYRYKPA